MHCVLRVFFRYAGFFCTSCEPLYVEFRSYYIKNEKARTNEIRTINLYLIMKLRNLLLTGIMLAMTSVNAIAQESCTFFFPNQEGEQLTRNCYTADGKLMNILVYRVDQVYDYPSGMEVIANYTFSDATGKALNSGQMVARCNDGDFSMSMSGAMSFPIAMDMLSTDIYMIGDLMNYPNAMSNPMNPEDDDEFDDATIRLYQKGNKENRAEVTLSDRRFVKTETVDTPAGPFYCTKIKYDIDVWTPNGKIEGYGYEWYAPNIGIVRSEQYNKNNELESYSVLNNIKK